MYFLSKQKHFRVPTFFILFLGLLTVLISPLYAAESTSVTATKTVDNATPANGDTVEYTIKIENTDTVNTATNIVITESALPAGLTYVASSSSATGTAGTYIVTPLAGTIAAPPLSWTISSLLPGAEVEIKYKATVSVSSGTLTSTSTVTHASLATSGQILNAVVNPTNVQTYTLYMPIIFRSPPGVTLSAIPYTVGATSWTLTWTPVSTQTGVTYEVQVDDNASFSSPTLLTPTAITATTYTHAGGSSNTGNLYYRVRAIENNVDGGWSNTQTVSFEYYDTFDSSTGWEVRRSRETPNARTITGGNLRVTTDTIWSNALVSPLVKAPGTNYTITTNALMHQRQDNHHFGIVFGGNSASGTACTAGATTDCFEDFYLLDVQHRYVSGSSLYDPAIYEVKVDKVNYTSGNAFNRTPITNWKTTDLDVADSHEWAIDVNTDGSFSVSANGTVLRTGTVDDASLLNSGYFGVIVMADENGSARTDFADFRVKAD